MVVKVVTTEGVCSVCAESYREQRIAPLTTTTVPADVEKALRKQHENTGCTGELQLEVKGTEEPFIPEPPMKGGTTVI